MTNYVNFKLSKDVEKNPGPTQYNTDQHKINNLSAINYKAMNEDPAWLNSGPRRRFN